MNERSWHKTRGCTPDHCVYHAPQCPQCFSCVSPMDMYHHDADCWWGLVQTARSRAMFARLAESLIESGKIPHARLDPRYILPLERGDESTRDMKEQP